MAKLFLYFISIFWIVVGVLAVFATDLVRGKFLNKLLELRAVSLKKLSAAPIIVGVLLFFSASSNAYRLYVIALGLIAVIKGIMLIVATEKMEKMLVWWLKASNNFYKVWGVIMAILGIILLKGINA